MLDLSKTFHLAELIQMQQSRWLARSYQRAEAAEMKEDEGGDDSEGPGGITDLDYAHSISPSERESVGPDTTIQPAPGLREETGPRSGQDTGTFPPQTFSV